MYEHNALGYWSGLALCLTKVRSSRARCPATALIHGSLTLTLKFAQYCLPLLQEKLSSDLKSAKIDSLQTLVNIVDFYCFILDDI